MFDKKITPFLSLFAVTFLVTFCFLVPSVHASICEGLSEVDINLASLEKLQCLQGIGPAYASRIIEERPFSSIDDLERVRGIGPVTVQKIKDQGLATVDGTSSSTGKSLEEERKDSFGEGDGEEIVNVQEDEAGEGKTIREIVVVRKYSAHSSPVELSSMDQVSFIEISAGRDRFTAVENEIDFKAYVKDSGYLPTNLSFEWVLGDGSRKTGRDIKHRYYAPGDYAVILTVRSGDEEAVSRVTVRVIEPKVLIEDADERGITLFNSSEGEINLGNWQINAENRTFYIPDNTIIQGDGRLVLPNQVTGIEVGERGRLTLRSPENGYNHTFRRGDLGLRVGNEISLGSVSQGDRNFDEAEKDKLRSEIGFLREEINRLVLSERENLTPASNFERTNPLNLDVSMSEEPPKEDSFLEQIEDDQKPVTKRVMMVYDGEPEKKGLWRRMIGASSAIFDRLPF